MSSCDSASKTMSSTGFVIAFRRMKTYVGGRGQIWVSFSALETEYLRIISFTIIWRVFSRSSLAVSW